MSKTIVDKSIIESIFREYKNPVEHPKTKEEKEYSEFFNGVCSTRMAFYACKLNLEDTLEFIDKCHADCPFDYPNLSYRNGIADMFNKVQKKVLG